MRLAHYELTEEGRFFATISGLAGLWAEAASLEECREELQSTLEDWMLLKLRHGDAMPVIDGIDLNAQLSCAKTD